MINYFLLLELELVVNARDYLLCLASRPIYMRAPDSLVVLMKSDTGVDPISRPCLALKFKGSFLDRLPVSPKLQKVKAFDLWLSAFVDEVDGL